MKKLKKNENNLEKFGHFDIFAKKNKNSGNWINHFLGHWFKIHLLSSYLKFEQSKSQH